MDAPLTTSQGILVLIALVLTFIAGYLWRIMVELHRAKHNKNKKR